jgi:hypothetical protein
LMALEARAKSSLEIASLSSLVRWEVFHKSHQDFSSISREGSTTGDLVGISVNTGEI